MTMQLLATHDYDPSTGGAARYHSALVRALAPNCDALVLPRERYWFRHYPRITAGLQRTRATQLIAGEVLPIGTIAWWLFVTTGIPYVIVCHGLDLVNASRSIRKRMMVRRILSQARAVIANSNYTAALARRAGARDSTLTIIHPPLGLIPDRHKVDQSHTNAKRDAVVLSVGRLVERKGFTILIDAVEQSRTVHPNLRLVIVGDGPRADAIRVYAARRRVPLRLMRTTTDDQLKEEFRKASVFALLPHDRDGRDVEGFGIVYREAGAFGLPVVGTQTGGVPEAIHDQVTGIIVPPEDSRAASHALSLILSDRDFALRLGNEGRRLARATHASFGPAIQRAIGFPVAT
jgi:phosphatidyl-myo-inositol dimannoside synthase